jgi:hypothetical protein
MGNEGIDENVILKLMDRWEQDNGNDATNTSYAPVDGFVNIVMSLGFVGPYIFTHIQINQTTGCSN